MVHTDREIELQHLFHQLQLSDGVPGTSISMSITPTSPNQTSLLSLCFPDEVIDDGVVVDPIEMIDGVVPHDEYRDEMDMMINFSMFHHLICLGCLPLRLLRRPKLFLFHSC